MEWSTLDDLLFASHLRDMRQRIESTLDALGYESLVVAAGTQRPVFQDDQHYPFRPNPWFSWLVPSPPSPGSLLQLIPGQPPRLLFVSPKDFWHLPPEPPDAPWTALFELHVRPLYADLVPLVKQNGGRTALIGEDLPPVADWDANPPDLLARLEQFRCHKSAYELACLREASRIGVAGHLAAERTFRQGASEHDILLAFLGATRQPESGLPYPPIIALNDHGATLHYQQREARAPSRPVSLLIDAGAGCRGYGSDITRTWAAGPGLFASMIEGMHALQLELCDAVAPGVDWRELHLRAHRLVAGLLRDAGIISLDPEAALASGVSAAFLPHGLGHLLGLQVHDVGGLRPAADAAPIPRPPGHPALRLTRTLEPGMVVTVEPGLYFIDSLLAGLRSGPHAGAVNWSLVEGLAPCGGIRIEDNVAVTATGHENLTRAAFAAVG